MSHEIKSGWRTGHNLQTLIRDFLYQFLLENFPPKKFLIAYSGGLDSHVLLHAMAKLRDKIPDIEIRAMHINHGMSVNADKWTQHCQKVCDELQVNLQFRKITATHVPENNVEAKLRTLRYRYLSEELTADTALLTAHTKNDQAETVLLQLFRGTGIRGLAGMPLKKKLGKSFLLRPFLNFTRSELEKYANENKLSWIEDESNQDLNFSRNYVRQILLPQIEKYWPNVVTTLHRNAKLCQETHELLFALAQHDLENVLDSSSNTLIISKLKKLPSVRQKQVLREWLRSFNLLMPSEFKISQIQKEVINARVDRKPMLKFGNVQIKRKRDWLVCCHSEQREESP